MAYVYTQLTMCVFVLGVIYYVYLGQKLYQCMPFCYSFSAEANKEKNKDDIKHENREVFFAITSTKPTNRRLGDINNTFVREYKDINQTSVLYTSGAKTDTGKEFLKRKDDIKKNVRSGAKVMHTIVGQKVDCSSLPAQEVTDERLLTFFKACVSNDSSVELGPDLFKRLFLSDVFGQVVCKDFETSFINNSAFVGLATFPGSGTTWFRLLLEQLTGNVGPLLPYQISR